jgi:LmbE family N-acetylglucosaminyl deacetylase
MPRLLVVVAHPDDETFGTGSVIANAAAQGVDVTVCCATRGEAGEDTSGTTSNSEELAMVREGELRAAAEVMGAREVVLLDFADSGFSGDIPARGLAAVPLDAVIAPVVDVIRRVEPDVVVTFDPVSVNDHRDHIRIGDATTHAFAQTAAPAARLYYWTLAHSTMRRWQDELKAKGLLEAYVDMELGLPDEQITTIVDVAHVGATRREAISCHKTQVSPFAGVSPELYELILSRDYLVRVIPKWNGGPIETSLF